MRKIYIYLQLIFVFTTFCYSQNIPFKIQKSEGFEDKYKKSNIILSEKDANGNIKIVRLYGGNGLTYKQGFYIEHYSSDLQLIKDFDCEIKHPNSEKFNVIIGVAYLNNVLNVVELYYDLKQKNYICQANCIDDNFQISKKELFRFSKEEVKKYGSLGLEQNFNNQSKQLYDFSNTGDFLQTKKEFDYYFSLFAPKYSISKNKSASNITMVTNETKTAFCIAIDFNGEKSELLKLYLFDDKLNKKIETDLKPDVNDKNCYFQNIQIASNEEAIYVVAKSYSSTFARKEKGGNYNFELTKITAKNQISQTINTNEHYISSLKTVLKNDQLICLGFYSDVKEGKFQGVSYFNFNLTSLEILKSKYSSFSEQFIIDKYGKKKDKGLKYLEIKNVFFTKNNDLILNAEEQYVQVYNNAGGKQISYNYDDIVCAKINPEGDLVWARNINKSQGTLSDNSYISYTSCFINDSNYFFINSDEKVKKLSNNRIEFEQIRKNKSNLNLIRINQNGEFDYSEILDDENSVVPFMVSKGMVLDVSLIFLGQKGKLKQLLKVSL